MYEQLWIYLLPFLKAMRSCLATPYNWDTSRDKFVVIKAPKYMRVFRTLSTFVLLHMGVILYGLLQSFRTEQSLLLRIISLGIVGMTSCFTTMRRTHTKVAAEIVQYLNFTVDFQRSSTESGDDLKISIIIKLSV
jgi:hypothetical protein